MHFTSTAAISPASFRPTPPAGKLSHGIRRQRHLESDSSPGRG